MFRIAFTTLCAVGDDTIDPPANSNGRFSVNNGQTFTKIGSCVRNWPFIKGVKFGRNASIIVKDICKFLRGLGFYWTQCIYIYCIYTHIYYNNMCTGYIYIHTEMLSYYY